MSATFDTAALLEGLGETFVYPAIAANVPSSPAAESLRALIARIERLPSIREVIDATIP
jgi:hypothetical protein